MELTSDIVFDILSKNNKNLNDIENLQEIIEFTKKSNDPISYNNMGLIYEIHHKDHKKAKKYYLKAIKFGVYISYRNLGDLYNNHYEDYKKAEECYLNSIKFGILTTYNRLGYLYQNKTKDYKKAEEYYLKACELGVPVAYNNLGYLYIHHYTDYEKAEEYLLKACELGVPFAYNNLGYLCYEHYKDYEKAEEYYKKYIDVCDESKKEQTNKVIKELLIINKKFTKVYTDIHNDECAVCKELLLGTKDGIIIFKCGHGYHINCATKCHLRCNDV